MRTLRQIRDASKKSCSDAARALGISRSAYYRKETGERPLQVEEARALADLYGVPVQDVVLSARVIAETGTTSSTSPTDER